MGFITGNVMDFSYFDRWIESLEDKASRIAEKAEMYTTKKHKTGNIEKI